MSYTQHRHAMRLALSASDELARLFNKLGNTEHPRGSILTAYRRARRALAGASRISPLVVSETFTALRGEITASVTALISEAVTYSLTQAGEMLSIYGLGLPTPGDTNTLTALAVVLSVVAQQENAIYYQVMTGIDLERILGDGTRVGILSPAPVNREATNILAGAMSAGWSGILGTLDRIGARAEFGKQAIAAIDHKTTDCCLRAHGQVVALDKPFKLTGTPRYADELDWVPFHWY